MVLIGTDDMQREIMRPQLRTYMARLHSDSVPHLGQPHNPAGLIRCAYHSSLSASIGITVSFLFLVGACDAFFNLGLGLINYLLLLAVLGMVAVHLCWVVANQRAAHMHSCHCKLSFRCTDKGVVWHIQSCFEAN